MEAIEQKLAKMKGEPKYNALPDGYYDKSFFVERFAAFVVAQHEYEKNKNKLESLKAEAVLALETSEDQKHLISRGILLYDRDLWALEHHFAEKKNNYLAFLLSMQPIDAKAYLAKKHRLLDQKLALIEKLRVTQLNEFAYSSSSDDDEANLAARTAAILD